VEVDYRQFNSATVKKKYPIPTDYRRSFGWMNTIFQYLFFSLFSLFTLITNSFSRFSLCSWICSMSLFTGA
jgi:hypothetical protein